MKSEMIRPADAVVESHPVRGAWIEISCIAGSPLVNMVAPREGCVD